jgi:lipopolysaccharide transport system permease protein
LAYSEKRRDLMHIGPFIVYFGIWFTPVFYPVSLVPAEFQHFIYLNPIAGMIDFFRWTIGINTTFSLFYFADFAVILALFFGAVFLFKNIEDSIVDTI